MNMVLQAELVPVGWAAGVAALGSIVTSCFTIWLAHRRVMADRETKAHREKQDQQITLIGGKLGLYKVDQPSGGLTTTKNTDATQTLV